MFATYGPFSRLMSSLRRRWAIFTNPQATIRFEGPVFCGPGFGLHIPGPGTFVVGPGVEFRRDFRAEISGEGRVTIGARTHFTYGVVIQCSTSVEIGEGCVLGQATFIVDGNHRFRDPAQPMLSQGYDYRPIRIGDEVGIMTKVTVIADIGDRAFIGANSVVSRPIPANSVAVGAPARVVDSFGDE